MIHIIDPLTLSLSQVEETQKAFYCAHDVYYTRKAFYRAWNAFYCTPNTFY